MASPPKGYDARQYLQNQTPQQGGTSGAVYLPPWGKSIFVGWLGRRPVAVIAETFPAPPPPPQNITAQITETQAPQTDAIAATVTPQ